MSSPPINLTPKEKEELERLARKATAPHRTVLRARVILLAAQGTSTYRISQDLHLDEETVMLWRRRWLASDSVLKAHKRLDDAPHSGRPPKFTAEQVANVVAIACEDPKKAGLPVSSWTHSLISEEMVKRGLVDTISRASVGRFLKSGGPQTAQDGVLSAQ